MITLRDYQENLVNAVRDELKKGHRRVMMVLPTGGGKTHVIGSIAARCLENGHKVLALMHRRQLVTQTVDRFNECGVDPGIIMSGEDADLEAKAQVGTCQTYNRRMGLDDVCYNRWWIDASVVFVDEAHHALSKTYQNILKTYENKIVIGVTATPVLSSGVGMGNYFDSLVSPVSVGELIKKGHLVPGVYYGPSTPDLSKIKTVAGDYEKKGLNKVMNQPKLIGDVVDNWLKIAGDKKTMVFAVKVNHSKALRREFESKGVKAEHLDAHAPDDVREATLNRFRSGETQVICNVGLYTEGTDIPDIECIVLARPTKSIGLHLQMIGRGARPYPGKDQFIVLDHGGNLERLGFYEDPIEWSLNGKELGFKKKIVRKGEKRYLTCDECSYMFQGKVCPQCGHEIADYGKRIEALDAELVKLNNREPKYTMEDKRRWYAMIEWERRIRGYKPGFTAANYKDKFGVWPRGMDGVAPMEPDQAVKNWLTHKRIRYAKRRKAEATA